MNKLIALATGLALSSGSMAMQTIPGADTGTQARFAMRDAMGVHPPQFDVRDAMGVHPPQFEVRDAMGVHPPQ
jgi:hypothetical protein